MHEERLNRKKINLINLISFLIGFSQAVLAYVVSSYFKESAGMENVGIYYIISYLLVFLALLNLHKIIRALGKSAVFFSTFFLVLISLSALVFLPPSLAAIVFLIVYLAASNLNWVSLDILLESFSTDKMSGRIRGLHLMIFDGGFIFGPLLSTAIIERAGFPFVFSLSLLINLLVLVLAFGGLRKVNHEFTSKITDWEIIKKVWQRKNVMRIYYVSFVLEFFYALMLIYTPIYLRDLGLAWGQIGLVFTVMLIPFIALPYPVGFLADKKFGEKEMIVAALLIMGLATLAIYFINSLNVIVWMSVLFATRIGASLIQTLRDSYFYKRIDGDDVDIINFFRNAVSLAYVLAAGVSSIILLFFPMKTIFVLVGLVVLSALWPAFYLKDNKSEEELYANS